MKHFVSRILVFSVFALSLAMPQAAAASDCHADASGNHGHDGKLIRETTVRGHTLSYRLIDMKAKMKDMKEMPEMEATHHLMLYIQPPEGQSLENPKVGFLVTGPGDDTQTVMAMGMSGGFGADLDLSARGAYTIKSKAVAGKVKLIDAFTYSVE